MQNSEHWHAFSTRSSWAQIGKERKCLDIRAGTAVTLAPRPFSDPLCNLFLLKQSAESPGLRDNGGGTYRPVASCCPSECQQHVVFPGGHPSKYWPCSRLLNCSDCMGTGVVNPVWPLAEHRYKCGWFICKDFKLKFFLHLLMRVCWCLMFMVLVCGRPACQCFRGL